MKLSELLEKEQTKEAGTYAGVHFSSKTKKAIHEYTKENKIPNSVRPDKMHTTLLYSRKPCPDYEPLGDYDKPMVGKPKALDVWETNKDASIKSHCLVLKYECEELVKRHKELMKEHDATWDHPDYIPHVTLSYDIGDLKVEDFSDFKDIGDIEIVEEYAEELDLDWAKNKGLKKGD